MAFTAIFYQFGKKSNSTAVPASTGTSFLCTANEPFDTLRPVFKLQRTLASAPVWNYVQISTLGRYYWVTSWSCQEGLWQCECVVDVLASWKTQIGQQSLYVLRSSSSYNGLLSDDKYQMTGEWQVDKQTSTSPWAAALTSRYNGRFVVGITGTTAVTYYLMTWGQFQNFMIRLFGDDYAGTVLTTLDITLYPEAKIAINPIQYISSIVFIPYEIPTASLTTVTEIKVGHGTVTQIQAFEFEYSSTLTVGADITFNVRLHPQGQTRGAYLNRPPYTDYRLFFPPWGMISLDGYMISRSASVTCRWYLDCHTGQGGLNVFCVRDNTEIMIAHLIGQIGVSYSVGQTFEPGFSVGSLLENAGQWLTGLTSMAGALTYAEAINAGGQTVSTLADVYRSSNIDPYIPQHSTVGAYGGYAGLAGGPVELLTTFKMVADDDLAQFGRPLCQITTLNTLSGFCQCRDADISIAGAFATELEQIRQHLLAGLFLE